MASVIRPIEAKSVHQIQSGQVIVDLCSVVKELVENALDADASSIEVRFKNNGLDAIEVQDNGTGISESNYENLALKHYTSKLSTYEDLLNVQTFGFRGEALSSLCALSQFSVITAQAHEVPKGKKLEFELSGRLKSTGLTPAQKGTTVIVENLFANLPVRQKELTKNIKREYGKVVGLLHAYACISTQVKFTIKNAMPKARSAVVFSTKGNSTTRDNIANVYGAKMLPQLIELDLKFEIPSAPTQTSYSGADRIEVIVAGYISKPVFGEGRQTPDRQMFFVNGRPCGLPQINKAVNEVYKSYNVTQSPFIFADFRMDTNAYDVNVSPDKRTILLHNASVLTDQLKVALTERFDSTEQTVPQSHAQAVTLPAYRQLTISKPLLKDGEPDQALSPSLHSNQDDPTAALNTVGMVDSAEGTPRNLLKQHFGHIASTREESPSDRVLPDPEKVQAARERQAEKIKKAIEKQKILQTENDEGDETDEQCDPRSSPSTEAPNIPVRDFNTRIIEQKGQAQHATVSTDKPQNVTNRQRREEEVGVVTSAFDRMRPRRPSPEIATITIGDRVVTRLIGSPKSQQLPPSGLTSTTRGKPVTVFSQRLQKFDLRDDRAESRVEQDPDSDSDVSSTHHVEQDDSSDEQVANFTANSGDKQKTASVAETSGAREEDEDERVAEEDRVAELIRVAEASVTASGRERQGRSAQALRASALRDSTVDQYAILDMDLDFLAQQAKNYMYSMKTAEQKRQAIMAREDSVKVNDEERLSLTISKADFAKMHVAGQFNLGFIIAVRHKDERDTARARDEVFIIDQHASDEKYNFERLQAETVVGNQRLVHAVMLELTAVEEEVVLENEAALQQNGFIIDADRSGQLPVGQRCKLLSLPLSKEVTFNMKDFEELIHLLSDSHISAHSKYVPRPSKVRKMFAMRACRSSIMIGKTLSKRQMIDVLDHMGRLDKPWNCPHGRPTMRHLTSLDKLDEQLWKEGNGLSSEQNNNSSSRGHSDAEVWRSYLE